MNSNSPLIGSSSIVGDREYQQDLSAYEKNGSMVCAVLCDGMGGMEGGEMASGIGVSCIMQNFREQPPDGIDNAGRWLEEAFAEADIEVAALRDSAGNQLGAGSTIIAVLIENMQMQWGCVGDSRIYLYREGTLNTITRMHNYNLQLEEMFRYGAISAEVRDKESARGEALISYLGVGGLPLIDIGTPLQLMPEDMIILCSDGLYKSLEDQQIRAVIEESGGIVELIAVRLVETAYRLAAGKQDNTTVVAIRIVT